jgi:hypothetical protein
LSNLREKGSSGLHAVVDSGAGGIELTDELALAPYADDC